MKNASQILFSAMVLFFASCNKINGDGPVESETRALSGYEGIDLRMSATVYFTLDTVYKVDVRAQRNILDNIETKISDNKLVIKHKSNIMFRSYEPIKVMVSGPSLRALRVSGSGDIFTTNAITSDRMDLDVSGSGNITVARIMADYAQATISGSGNIEMVTGTIKDESLKVSGSGNINLSGITASKASTTTSGSGNIRLAVTQDLNVTISGSGSVFYKGNPEINTRISGSGKVVRM